jgi:regulatory protein
VLNSKDKALIYAIKLLTYRPRTQKEISKALYLKGYSEKKISDVVNYLIDMNYLNDINFMESWIYFRQYVSPRGSSFVKQELLHKGISASYIEEHFDQMFSQKKEKEYVRKLVSEWIKKKQEIGFINDKDKNNLINKLYRKGFDYHLVLEIYNFLETE